MGLLLAGCWPSTGFVHDEVFDGPYRLVAVDADEQMGICWSIPNSSDCVGDGLPSDTVVAAGADRRYLVAERRVTGSSFGGHPETIGDTEYYYIIRTPDDATRPVGKENIVGPLSLEQFELVKRRLRLPEFTKRFDELR